MDDISFQSNRNESLYLTNSQAKFSNYYSYPSPNNNTNQSFYMYEPPSNNINTYAEPSVVCPIEVYPSNDVLNKNDYQSQDNQIHWVQPSISGRRRRQRTVFSQSHIQQLENVFVHNQYPDIDLRETLAVQLGVSESRIQVWFKNRRNRARTAQRQQNKTFD